MAAGVEAGRVRGARHLHRGRVLLRQRVRHRHLLRRRHLLRLARDLRAGLGARAGRPDAQGRPRRDAADGAVRQRRARHRGDGACASASSPRSSTRDRALGTRPRDRGRHRPQTDRGDAGNGARDLGVARPAVSRRDGARPDLHAPRQPDRLGRGGRAAAPTVPSRGFVDGRRAAGAQSAHRRRSSRSTRRRPRWSSSACGTAGARSHGHGRCGCGAVSSRASGLPCCCATGPRRSGCSSACCAPARASSRSTRARYRTGPRRSRVARRGHRRGASPTISSAFGTERAPARERHARVRRPSRRGSGGHRCQSASEVAVEMLTSGTTGPPKRVPLTYETFWRVLAGAKHYETQPRLGAPAAARCGDRQRAAGASRRPVPRAQCVSDGRSFCLLERFRVDDWVDAVRRHRPPTVSLVPAALRMVLDADLDPADLASVSSVVSRHGAALDPDDADAFFEQVRRAGARHVRGHRVRRRVSRGGTSPTTSGSGRPSGGASDAPIPAASCASSTPRPVRPLGPDAEGLLEVKARQLGDEPRLERARPTWPASTPTASCGSSAAPTRRSSAAGSRSGPTTSAPRSNATRGYAARPSSASTTRGSARFRSRRSSCGRVAWPVDTDRAAGATRRSARALRAADRAADRRRAAAHPVGQGRPGRPSASCSPRWRSAVIASGGRSACEPLPQTRSRRAVAAAGRRAGAWRWSSDDAAVDQADRRPAPAEAGPRGAASRPTLAPRIGARRGRRASASTSTTAATSARTTRAFPSTRSRSTAHRASGSVTFPLAFEGPPGIVHGGVLATFFDCVDPAPQLRRRRGRQDHARCSSSTAGPTPLGVAARRSRSTGRPTIAGSRSRARLFARRRHACAPPRCEAVAGDRAGSRRSRRAGCARERGARRRGDGLPLTVAALLRARAARRGDHPLLICDDDVADLRRRPTRDPPRWPRGCSRAAPARARTSACCYPNGSDFVVGWLAAARIGAIAVPLSTFSTSPELPRTVARVPTSRSLLATATFRGRDYVDALRDAVPGLDCGGARRCSRSLGAGAARSCSPPRVRRRARVDGRRCRGGGRCSRRRRSARGRGSGPARGPHGHRAHVGFDERAEGRDPSARPADPPPRQPQRAPPLRRGRGAVLELAVLLDRRLRVRPARHAARGRDAGLLERHRPRGDARPARARRGPRW